MQSVAARHSLEFFTYRNGRFTKYTEIELYIWMYTPPDYEYAIKIIVPFTCCISRAFAARKKIEATES